MELHLSWTNRAGDFNKEISGKTKVRRYERGEKRPVNDLPRLYNREFTAYRRHRCTRETRRKEKKRGERKREEYAPRPRLLIFYASHLMTLVREGPFELGPKRPVRRRRGAFSGTLFPLFVPWNVLTLKRGSRSAHDISAGDLTPGLLWESFRSNENMEGFNSNNFTLWMFLLLSTVITVLTESLLIPALNVQFIWWAFEIN